LKSPVSLIKAAKSKGRIRWQQSIGVLASLGITGVGVWMVYAAIIDPEPTAKLGLLIGGGIIIALTGSLGTLSSLGIRVKIIIKSPKGGEIKLDQSDQ